uniref:Uncharacterized protein n=1 Tax=Rangifer tarandus platyrhynchus TaxID=3082113 RepID=A0ACB0ERV6_RANTA|nr:unnamed protein product [Rangifer tarandus platyrhynchus]
MRGTLRGPAGGGALSAQRSAQGRQAQKRQLWVSGDGSESFRRQRSSVTGTPLPTMGGQSGVERPWTAPFEAGPSPHQMDL